MKGSFCREEEFQTVGAKVPRLEHIWCVLRIEGWASEQGGSSVAFTYIQSEGVNNMICAVLLGICMRAKRGADVRDHGD